MQDRRAPRHLLQPGQAGAAVACPPEGVQVPLDAVDRGKVSHYLPTVETAGQSACQLADRSRVLARSGGSIGLRPAYVTMDPGSVGSTARIRHHGSRLSGVCIWLRLPASSAWPVTDIGTSHTWHSLTTPLATAILTRSPRKRRSSVSAWCTANTLISDLCPCSQHCPHAVSLVGCDSDTVQATCLLGPKLAGCTGHQRLLLAQAGH